MKREKDSDFAAIQKKEERERARELSGKFWAVQAAMHTSHAYTPRTNAITHSFATAQICSSLHKQTHSYITKYTFCRCINGAQVSFLCFYDEWRKFRALFSLLKCINFVVHSRRRRRSLRFSWFKTKYNDIIYCFSQLKSTKKHTTKMWCFNLFSEFLICFLFFRFVVSVLGTERANLVCELEKMVVIPNRKMSFFEFPQKR